MESLGLLGAIWSQQSPSAPSLQPGQAPPGDPESPVVGMVPKSWLFPFPDKPCGPADMLEGRDGVQRNLDRLEKFVCAVQRSLQRCSKSWNTSALETGRESCGHSA